MGVHATIYAGHPCFLLNNIAIYTLQCKNSDILVKLS